MFPLNRNGSSSSPFWCCCASDLAFSFFLFHRIKYSVPFMPVVGTRAICQVGGGKEEAVKATHVLHGNFMWQRRRRRTTACQYSGSGGGHGSSCTCMASHWLWPWVMEVKGGEKGVAEAADDGVKAQVWRKMENGKLPEVKPGAYLLLVGRVLILGCNET